jgi:hypothetical protein
MALGGQSAYRLDSAPSHRLDQEQILFANRQAIAGYLCRESDMAPTAFILPRAEPDAQDQCLTRPVSRCRKFDFG